LDCRIINPKSKIRIPKWGRSSFHINVIISFTEHNVNIFQIIKFYLKKIAIKFGI
jgi:hypothetical protein